MRMPRARFLIPLALVLVAVFIVACHALWRRSAEYRQQAAHWAILQAIR